MAANLAIAERNGVLRLNTYNMPLDGRRCGTCRKVYLRRNLTEMWTKREEGSRYGWEKDKAKTCMDCMSENESKKIIGIADVNFKKTIKIRAAA